MLAIKMLWLGARLAASLWCPPHWPPNFKRPRCTRTCTPPTCTLGALPDRRPHCAPAAQTARSGCGRPPPAPGPAGPAATGSPWRGGGAVGGGLGVGWGAAFVVGLLGWSLELLRSGRGRPPPAPGPAGSTAVEFSWQGCGGRGGQWWAWGGVEHPCRAWGRHRGCWRQLLVRATGR